MKKATVGAVAGGDVDAFDRAVGAGAFDGDGDATAASADVQYARGGREGVAEGEIDEFFGFRARDEHAGIHQKVEIAEGRASAHVLNGFALEQARDGGFKGAEFVGAWIVVQGKLREAAVPAVGQPPLKKGTETCGLRVEQVLPCGEEVEIHGRGRGDRSGQRGKHMRGYCPVFGDAARGKRG
jgi:hypothetical protein